MKPLTPAQKMRHTLKTYPPGLFFCSVEANVRALLRENERLEERVKELERKADEQKLWGGSPAGQDRTDRARGQGDGAEC